ncbi:hypothetical protein [Streptomyces marincola]|uniref:Uncharacterized protein n=1 Tax=Streptomyces marincola TaxID=2878388 RepID=A0A1W7CTE1_9ACTN|nr:hypothetical protein [Streptomyces marincola]ARQ68002.1 hypothetical protein CAG99_03390 [Streptomyces marincola]
MDEREAQRRGYPLTIPESLLRSEGSGSARTMREAVFAIGALQAADTPSAMPHAFDALLPGQER